MADRIAGKTSCGAFEEGARSVEILTMAGTRTSLLAFAERPGQTAAQKLARGSFAGAQPLHSNLEPRSSMPSSRRWRPNLRLDSGAVPANGAHRHGMSGAAFSHIYTTSNGTDMALSQNNDQAPGGILFGRHSLCKRSESIHRHTVCGRASSNTATLSRYSTGIFWYALRSGHRRTSRCLNHCCRRVGTSLTAVHRLDMDTSESCCGGKTRRHSITDERLS